MKIINLKFSLSSLLLSSSIFHEISSERQKLTQKQKLKALKNEFKVLNIQYGMLYDEMLKLNATIDGHLNVHTGWSWNLKIWVSVLKKKSVIQVFG